MNIHVVYIRKSPNPFVRSYWTDLLLYLFKQGTPRMNSGHWKTIPFFLLILLSTSLSGKQSEYQITEGKLDTSELNDHLQIRPLTKTELDFLGRNVEVSNEGTQTVWGVLEVLNATGRDHDYVLQMSRDFGAEKIIAYVVIDNQLVETRESSCFVCDSPKDIENQHDFFVSLFIPRGKNVAIYLENYPNQHYPPFFDLALYSSQDWYQRIVGGLGFQSVFYGVLWVLMILSFVLFAQTKDRVFLFYSLYLFCFSVFSTLALNQTGIVLKLPKLPMFFVLFVCFFNAFYLHFLRRFLSLPSFSPLWDRLLKYLANGLFVFGLISALGVFFIDTFLFIDLVARAAILISIVAIICVTVVALLRNSEVKLYVGLGTLSMVTGMAVSTTHVVMFNDQTTIYGQLGVLCEVIIFSIGLGYRIQNAVRQHREMQEQLISELKKNEQLQITMNHELERIVAESTKEIRVQKQELEKRAVQLEEQNTSLTKVSSFKDQLFAIIGHDLRSPIKSLKAILEQHTRGNLNQQQLELFISKVHKSLNRVITLLDNVLMWALQQMDHIDYKPSMISVRALVNENIELLTPLALDKGIELINRVDGKLEAFVDSEMINLVIRNILSNAIKFSNKGDGIEITGNDGPDTIQLHVSDRGIGIPSESLDKLFDDVVYTTYGTNREKGTGLGLTLCSQFVRKNNGYIHVESEPGKGSTFTIELPTKKLRLTA